MTAPGTTQQAEHLWVTAHEHVRRGDFAAATRDLAGCFQILQALKDPRVSEVHKRWTEVHKLYVEDGARAVPSTSKAAPAPTLEAEAEAAANAGNLEQAILLYEQALQKQPQNELVAERLTELRAARPRAAELTEKRPDPPARNLVVDDAVRQEVAAVAAAAEPERPAVEQHAEQHAEQHVQHVEQTVEQVAAAAVVAEDDFGDINEPEARVSAPVATTANTATSTIDAAVAHAAAHDSVSDGIELADGPALDLDIHNAPTLVPVAAPSTPVATTAHVMAASEAGVGLQSLDVDIDMGDPVTAAVADELPVTEQLPEERPAALTAEDPRWGAQPQAALTAEDPRWGAPPQAALTAEDPRWGTSSSSPAPAPAPAAKDDVATARDVALLESLLLRVQTNRRVDVGSDARTRAA